MLLGPVLAVALVVGVAGLAKVRRPAAAAATLEGLGLPGPMHSSTSARVLGAVELMLAAAVVVTGARSALVALTLACSAFVAVTAVLLRRPHVPCGCFGDERAPATAGGMAADVLLLLVAVAGLIAPPGGPAQMLFAAPATTIATWASAGLLAWLLVNLHAIAPGRRPPTAAGIA